MNRDMDVIRRIALRLRETDDALSALDGVADEAFNYNAQLMIEAGLADGSAVGSVHGKIGVPLSVCLFRLTWEGHDFADSIKDETLWEKAKEKVVKPTGSWTFGILKEFIKFEIKRRLGMGDGA